MQALRFYFPNLTELQYQQFEQLEALYQDWNAKINVISRKDIESLYTNHVLHSLAIAKVQAFVPGSNILDVGTGGGFPGIPLAILFPETQFHLIDVIQKKNKSSASGSRCARITKRKSRATSRRKRERPLRFYCESCGNQHA